MITNYATLQTSVADWLNRADLNSQIPTFIQLAEGEFNSRIRVRQMQLRAETTSDEGFVELPADFLEPYALTIESGTPRPPLAFVGVDEAIELKAKGLTGDTVRYTIFGDSLELLPDPGDPLELELYYFAKIPALTESNTTNWLLAKRPDIYLLGALMQSAPYLKDDERVGMWVQGVDRIIEQMHLESERSTKPQAALNARLRGFG